MYITVKFIQINSEKSTITRSPSSRMNNLVYKEQVLHIHRSEIKIKVAQSNVILTQQPFLLFVNI